MLQLLSRAGCVVTRSEKQAGVRTGGMKVARSTLKFQAAGWAAAEQAADGKKVGSATTEESLLAGAVGALVSAERMGADEPVTRARP